MYFLYHENSEIPRLAWCLRLSKGSDCVSVAHGSMVETQPLFFVEGGWAGDFAKGAFDGTPIMAGSGAMIKRDQLVICAAGDTLECVYSITNDNEFLCSNSLAFVLDAANMRLDGTYLDYEADAMSVSDGLDRYKKEIPTANGGKVSLHYCVDILVGRDMAVKTVRKSEPPHFTDFQSYYGYLQDCLHGLSDNFRSKDRRMELKPIVFCSAGYDSPVCAALGRDIGCDEAVVIESKREERSDSGRRIVEKLGYSQIHEKYELEYLAYDHAEEFVATGELGSGIFFAVGAAELRGKYLLAGAHGDGVWERTFYDGSGVLLRARGFLPGTDKKEFRLQTGFINVPIAYWGAVRGEEIWRISNSPEMLPWTLNTLYDRPISRRIVEGRGVPREYFGIKKHGGAGTSLRFLGLGYLRKVMPAASYADFANYVRQATKRRPLTARMIARSILYTLFCASIKLDYMGFHKFGQWLGVEKWDRRLKCSPWAPSFLCAWGVEKLGRKYHAATVMLSATASEKTAGAGE